jgi:hypothetical protein
VVPLRAAARPDSPLLTQIAGPPAAPAAPYVSAPPVSSVARPATGAGAVAMSARYRRR